MKRVQATAGGEGGDHKDKHDGIVKVVHITETTWDHTSKDVDQGYWPSTEDMIKAD